MLLTTRFQVRLLIVILAAIFPVSTLAQKTELTIESAPTRDKSVVITTSPTADETGTNNDVSAQASPPVKSKVPAEVKVEIQKHFNELQREFLDNRADTIDWWLAVVAIVLTVFGIVIPIVGFFGFRRFREIEVEAKNSAETAAEHAKDAKRHMEDIEKNRDKSYEIIRNLNAQSVADCPDKARKAVAKVRENTEAPLIDRAIAHAVSLQEQGQTDAAIEKWRAIAHVAEENDNNFAARAWFSIGYLLSQKSSEESISAYDRAIDLNPSVAGTYNNRGIEKSDLGRYDEAIVDFDEAIRLDPYDPKPYNSRGLAKATLGQYDEAIADYDEALRLHPDYSTVYNNRGNARIELGQYEAAIADYSERIRLDPEHFGAFSNRGKAYIILERFDDAIADFDAAISLNSNYVEAYIGRGYAKAKLSRDSQAYQDLETALTLAQNAGDAEAVMRVEQYIHDLDLKDS